MALGRRRQGPSPASHPPPPSTLQPCRPAAVAPRRPCAPSPLTSLFFPPPSLAVPSNHSTTFFCLLAAAAAAASRCARDALARIPYKAIPPVPRLRYRALPPPAPNPRSFSLEAFGEKSYLVCLRASPISAETDTHTHTRAHTQKHKRTRALTTPPPPTPPSPPPPPPKYLPLSTRGRPISPRYAALHPPFSRLAFLCRRLSLHLLLPSPPSRLSLSLCPSLPLTPPLI